MNKYQKLHDLVVSDPHYVNYLEKRAHSLNKPSEVLVNSVVCANYVTEHFYNPKHFGSGTMQLQDILDAADDLYLTHDIASNFKGYVLENSMYALSQLDHSELENLTIAEEVVKLTNSPKYKEAGDMFGVTAREKAYEELYPGGPSRDQRVDDYNDRSRKNCEPDKFNEALNKALQDLPELPKNSFTAFVPRTLYNRRTDKSYDFSLVQYRFNDASPATANVNFGVAIQENKGADLRVRWSDEDEQGLPSVEASVKEFEDYIEKAKPLYEQCWPDKDWDEIISKQVQILQTVENSGLEMVAHIDEWLESFDEALETVPQIPNIDAFPTFVPEVLHNEGAVESYDYALFQKHFEATTDLHGYSLEEVWNEIYEQRDDGKEHISWEDIYFTEPDISSGAEASIEEFEEYLEDAKPLYEKYWADRNWDAEIDLQTDLLHTLEEIEELEELDMVEIVPQLVQEKAEQSLDRPIQEELSLVFIDEPDQGMQI